MIELQRVQNNDLKEQLNSLTSSADGDNPSTVVLQRQIQKLNKSIKMKDEFCSILSSELKKVQDELQGVKETNKKLSNSKDIMDGSIPPSKDSGISSEGNAEQEVSLHIRGLYVLWLLGNVFSIDEWFDCGEIPILTMASFGKICNYFITCELPSCIPDYLIITY